MNKNIYIEDIPSIELGGQLYTSEDTSLISSFETGSNFNPDKDYIEYLVFNGNKQVVDTVSNLGTYRLYDNDLNIFPEQDLDDRGYNQGQYYTLYHFLTPLLSSSVDSPYYISEISSDRTEIRLASTDIIANDILTGAEALINNLETLPYYEDFFLNFGANNLIIANNILIDETDPEELTLLIKLYEPLPDQFQINSQTWAVEKIAESRAYLINIQTSFDAQDGLIKLAGPNLNLPIKSQENKSTDLTNTAALKQTDSNALRNQLDSALNVPGVELNIDYSDFSNFIFFSSARTRLENYYYKLGLIEEYNYSASLNTESGSYYNSGSLAYWETKINETITNFDGFEYYLYYESGSTAWPKSNDTPPYVNVPTTSSAGQTWLTDRLSDADTFDNDNKDLLNLTIPEFIKNDPANSNYELFVDMAGQLYDEVWLYLKDVTQKYNTSNGVDQGISKDLVAQALKDVGIKLYQNNFTSDDLFSTYLGITPSGSLLPNTGQELIETYVTASATGSLVPIDNLSSEVHKRLYHNLPLLLKKKGTAAGLRTLINAFGIPDTILRINEFGGKDKNPNTWDYDQNEYDYAFNTSGSGFVNIEWGAEPFTFTVDTTIAGTSGVGSFALPLVSSTGLDILVDWGDDTTDSITSHTAPEVTHAYSSAGTYTIKIYGSLTSWRFDGTGDKLKMGELQKWGIFIAYTGNQFEQCSNMTITATDAPKITTTSFYQWFRSCTSVGTFDLRNWDVSNVTTFNQMFIFNSGCIPKVETWDVSSATSLSGLFYYTGFNGDLSGWDVSNVTNMGTTFRSSGFNNDSIVNWDVSNVQDFTRTFQSSFNQDISGWDVGSVTTMNGMFYTNTSFNQPIGDWDVSNVTIMSQMFRGANSFDQDIGSWDVSNVTNMYQMFRAADAFDQDISNWDITNVTDFSNFMYQATGLSTANYDALLIGWEATLQSAYPGGSGYTPSITIHFGGSTYTAGGAAETAKTSLETTYGWVITDGGTA